MVGRLLIIVDTGYWLELFQVPDKSSKSAHLEVKNRFKVAINKGASLFWPLPSLYETANIIAQVKDGTRRIALAKLLYKKVADSFSPNSWLSLTPACECDQEKLLAFIKVFSEKYAPQSIGLVDAAIIHEARRLKSKHNQVHIWTTDRKDVKSHEPDKEKNPFCGDG